MTIGSLYHAPELPIIRRNRLENPNTKDFFEDKNAFLLVGSDDAFEMGIQDIGKLIEETARIRIESLGSGVTSSLLDKEYLLRVPRPRFYYPIFGEAAIYSPEYFSAIERLGAAMTDVRDYEEDIGTPAGYTYLGQFIAHDLTRAEPPQGSDQLANQQTAALDLDSIYGPNDEQRADGSNRLYEGQIKSGTVYRGVARDILRDADNGTPAIFNARNDDNLLLSQTHVAIVAFHNALAEKHPTLSFECIKAKVILTFQAIVLYDYLPKVVENATWNRVVRDRTPGFWYRNMACSEQHRGNIPAEMAFAVLRFGHSMVRPRYDGWNSAGDPKGLGQFLHFTFLGQGISHFNNKIPGHWITNWRSMFGDYDRNATIFARPIDCNLTNFLAEIPRKNLPPRDNSQQNVATRTLRHCANARLKSGLEIRTTLENEGMSGFSIDENNIVSPKRAIQDAFADSGELLRERPPLWYYILREAEFSSIAPHNERNCLTGIGAQLLCETLMEAVESAVPSVIGARIEDLPIGTGFPEDARMIDLLRAIGDLDWHEYAKI